ncbi:hypothetical protein [Dyella japonica]|uniref:Uncharacterized protein n=1 Tax=Dyella japonica TaxID=231455 RepID=A0ABV2JVS6_9GAMM
MRRIAVGLAWIGALAFATSHAMDAATASYTTARDRAIAELNDAAPHMPDAELVRRDHASLQKLGSMMEGIVGPIHLEGFPTKGEYNLDTLLKEMGFGMLDGMSVKSDDGQILAVVTTESLLRIWLAQNSEDLQHPPKSGSMDVVDAFVSGEFYTSAMSDSDIAYNKYAELPVDQGAGIARAILFKPYQDYPAPYAPTGVLVAVMRGNRVVLFRKALVAPDIPECSAAYARDSKKAREQDAADRGAVAAGRVVGPSVDRDETLSNAFIHCYALRLPRTASYPALVREAQALVDLVK